MKFIVAIALAIAFLGSSVSAQDATTYMSRGDAQYKAGQYRQAVDSYQHVVQLQPNNAQAYRRLGDAYERLGMSSQAADAWEKEAQALAGANAPPAKIVPVGKVRHSSTASAPRNKQQRYRAGQRVEYVDYGKWYKAIVMKVRDDAYAPYFVHPLGYITTQDHWVPASYIRAPGSGGTQPIPGGEANDIVLRSMHAGAKGSARTSSGAVAQKRYHCVFFVVDHLVDAAPLTITGSGYTDSSGAHGTYTMAGSTLTFHGGNYDGRRAEYEVTGGLPTLHILGPSGRPVIDCD